MPVRIDDGGQLRRWADALQAAPQQVLDAVAETLTEETKTLVTLAQRRAPVATGRLRRSITQAVTPVAGRVEARVQATAPYAAFMEFGTRPHMPPIAPLQRWARAKRLNPWALQRAIAQRGTRARPFLQPALAARQAAVQAAVREAVQAVVRRIFP